MDSHTITLPYPQSLNTLYRFYRGHMILTKEGHTYKKTIGWMYKAAKLPKHPKGKDIAVLMNVWVPDKRRRDIMNLEKIVSDGLSGVAYDDDSQIVDYRIVKRGMLEGGKIELTIACIN